MGVCNIVKFSLLACILISVDGFSVNALNIIANGIVAYRIRSISQRKNHFKINS